MGERKPAPTEAEVREWIRMYVEDNLSYFDLGLEVGRDPATVRRHCLGLGMESRPASSSRPKGNRTNLKDGVGPRSAMPVVPRSGGGRRRRRRW